MQTGAAALKKIATIVPVGAASPLSGRAGEGASAFAGILAAATPSGTKPSGKATAATGLAPTETPAKPAGPAKAAHPLAPRTPATADRAADAPAILPIQAEPLAGETKPNRPPLAEPSADLPAPVLPGTEAAATPALPVLPAVLVKPLAIATPAAKPEPDSRTGATAELPRPKVPATPVSDARAPIRPNPEKSTGSVEAVPAALAAEIEPVAAAPVRKTPEALRPTGTGDGPPAAAPALTAPLHPVSVPATPTPLSETATPQTLNRAAYAAAAPIAKALETGRPAAAPAALPAPAPASPAAPATPATRSLDAIFTRFAKTETRDAPGTPHSVAAKTASRAETSGESSPAKPSSALPLTPATKATEGAVASALTGGTASSTKAQDRALPVETRFVAAAAPTVIAAAARAVSPTPAAETATPSALAETETAAKPKPVRAPAATRRETAEAKDVKDPKPSDEAVARPTAPHTDSALVKAAGHQIVPARTADTAPALAAAAPQDQPAAAPPASGDTKTADIRVPLARDIPGHAALIAPSLAIRVHSQGGATRAIEIRLDPPDLGHVDVRLETGSDGKLKAVIQADSPQAVETLRRESGTLESALRDAGVALGEDGLSFSLSEQGSDQAGAQRRDAIYAGANRRLDDRLHETAAAAPAWRNGALDIQV